MQYCAFVLFCAGAGALSIIEDEALSIQMPEAISVAKTMPLDKGQNVKALDELSAAPYSASQKPMIKAKLHKIAQFLNMVKDEYEEGTDDQKKAIQTKAFSLVMNTATVRDHEGDELCQVIWGSSNQLSGLLSWYYCPSLTFPFAGSNCTGQQGRYLWWCGRVAEYATSPPSRLRSAILSKAFWVTLLTKDIEGVDAMFSPGVCYVNGAAHKMCGKGRVMRHVPYIGFPQDTTSLSEPAYWHCDTTTCILPLTAWAKHQNYVLSSFGPQGKVVEVIIPLNLWR